MRWADQSTDPARALAESRRLQEQASSQGFDWPALTPLWDKLHEEIEELRSAIAQGDHDAVRGELGDLLFMLVNFSRFLQVDAEAALDQTNAKFIRRLQAVERGLQRQQRDWAQCSMDELEALWQQAKREE